MPGRVRQCTPREVFANMQRRWLAPRGSSGADGRDDLGDDFADDVVIELPFARPGRPTRFEGRQEFLDATAPEREAFPVQFEEVRNVVIHDTADPEVIVVEYELVGRVVTTGHRAAAPFIGVLRVRHGRAVLWREYQHVAAIAAALQPQ
jgi:uncharacterized protein